MFAEALFVNLARLETGADVIVPSNVSPERARSRSFAGCPRLRCGGPVIHLSEMIARNSSLLPISQN